MQSLFPNPLRLNHDLRGIVATIQQSIFWVKLYILYHLRKYFLSNERWDLWYNSLLLKTLTKHPDWGNFCLNHNFEEKRFISNQRKFPSQMICNCRLWFVCFVLFLDSSMFNANDLPISSSYITYFHDNVFWSKIMIVYNMCDNEPWLKRRKCSM